MRQVVDRIPPANKIRRKANIKPCTQICDLQNGIAAMPYKLERANMQASLLLIPSSWSSSSICNKPSPIVDKARKVS
ncbi:hypothetical protein Bca101_064954 [Brassica carinata]